MAVKAIQLGQVWRHDETGQTYLVTKLYNEVDEGAWRDLREAHCALDEAVVAAYGWPLLVAHDPSEANRHLLELNRTIAAGELLYEPFERRVSSRPEATSSAANSSAAAR